MTGTGLRRRRLRRRLAVLVAVTVVPLVCLNLVRVWQGYRADLADAREQTESLARSVVLGVEAEMQRRLAALETLAMAASAEDVAALRARAEAMVARQFPGAVILLVAPDGQQLFNTSAPPGEPLPPVRRQDLLQRVLAGESVVSDLFTTSVVRRPAIAIGVPVRDAGGTVRRALWLNVPPEAIHEVLGRQPVPEGWIAAVLDRNGTIIGRNVDAIRALGQKPVPAVLQFVLSGRDGALVAPALEGRTMLSSVSHGRAFGWAAAVGVPETQIYGPAMGEAFAAIGYGAAMLILGLLAAGVLARGITRPIERLREVARGPVTDRPVRTGLAETDEVATVLWSIGRERARINEQAQELVSTLDLAATLVRGMDGRVRFWSQGCERLYGWSAAEAAGQPTHALLQTVFPVPPAEIAATLEAAGEWTGDLRQIRRDGQEIIVSVRKVLRRDAAGRPAAVLETVADVTPLREAQAALARLNEELEQRVREEIAAREQAQQRAAQAERLQALGQLAGGIAHDINNVLQAVQGAGALIEQRAEDPASVRRFARLLLEAVTRGAGITRRLLSFARRAPLEATAVAPRALLGDLHEILAHTLGAHIRVEVEAGPDLPPILADKGQLEVVLVNLAANGRDAMKQGGTLTLSVRAGEAAEGIAQGLILNPGAYVRIAVRDTGTGMDAATLARASEPFFSTKPRGEGTGLGLAMARGFAEQSGGALQIESRPGAGTTVTLWLPAAASGAASGTAPVTTTA